jgi:hypothetical protein
VGYEYTFNRDGSVTEHGPGGKQQIIFPDTTYGDQMAFELLKLYGQAAAAGATGGGSTLFWATFSAVSIAAAELPEDEETDAATKAMAAGIGPASRSISVAFTEPELPPKVIAEENGVRFEQNYRSDDHAPAHTHVIEDGTQQTKIRRDGSPLPGEAPMSPKQRAVYERNKQQIQRSLIKIGRWLRYMKYLRRG